MNTATWNRAKQLLGSRGTLVLASVLAIVLRWTQLHPGLLYPDGYQYLLSARGIAEHGRPVTRLGPGGDLFVPNPDAAAKPLFALLIAVLHLLGLPLSGSAAAITVIASAAVAVLCAAIVLRLTGSWFGAALAFAVCLASPSLGYWWGFAGPDAVAAALALGAGLALVSARPALAGALAGAAASTRPELAVLAAAATVAGLAGASTRAAAIRGGTACVFVLAAVWLAVRPPLALPPFSLLAAGATATLVAATLLGLARQRAVLLTAGAALAAALVLSPGGTAWLHSDWPLACLATASIVGLIWSGTQIRASGAIMIAAAALALIYHLKNPSSDRYIAEVVPLFALLTGFGASQVGRLGIRRAATLAVAAAATIAGLSLSSAHAPPGVDSFAALAPKLDLDSQLPLITAAPDAYGFLLPRRTVHGMRAGASGLVLLDGAQRAYEPGLAASGTVVATFDQAAFARPNGSIDRQELTLVRGVVVERVSRSN